MLHQLWGVLSHFVPSVQPLLEPHWTLFKARHFLFAFGTGQTGLVTFTPQGPPSAQNHHYGNQLLPHQWITDFLESSVICENEVSSSQVLVKSIDLGSIVVLAVDCVQFVI